MKKQYNGKKLRYGSSGAMLIAVVIAAVILLNVAVSALASRFSFMYIDMTPEGLYDLTDDFYSLIEKEALTAVDEMREFNKQYNAAGGKNLPDVKDEISDGADDGEFVPRDENLKIRIYFMDEKDILRENAYMGYILKNVEDLCNKFPDYFEYVCINTDKNPSAVQKFLTTSLSTISKTDVVVECGTEFRTVPLLRFFVTDTSTEEVWGYDGEKQLASSILAVTRAESPVCLVDLAHGEAFYDPKMLYTIEDAGYQLAVNEGHLTDEVIEKVEEEYGADVRLLLIYNPNSDFLVNAKDSNGNVISDVDEIGTIDRFLDGKSSMMVFMSPTSPVLPNLEEYLEEWGIAFERQTVGAETAGYMVKDTANSLTADGHSIVAEYVTGGMGGSLTQSMRGVTHPKKIIFRNAMPIRYSDTYQETTDDPNDPDSTADTELHTYGSYYKNGVTRTIYDLFRSSSGATAMAGGETVAEADEHNRFRFMTVSCELRTTQENNYSELLQENSYVIACGSTEFCTEGYLQSAVYGNTDLLMSALTVIGREPVPVGIVLKPFGDYTIDSVTVEAMMAWTVCLAVIPATAALVTGVVVLVRRKYA